VANAVANAFVLSNLEQKTKFTSTTGDFLQQRIAELQSLIRTDESGLTIMPKVTKSFRRRGAEHGCGSAVRTNSNFSKPKTTEDRRGRLSR